MVLFKKKVQSWGTVAVRQNLNFLPNAHFKYGSLKKQVQKKQNRKTFSFVLPSLPLKMKLAFPSADSSAE